MSKTPITKPKILIVDDDESILDALMLILVDEGFQVEMTDKGEEIFNKVDIFQPDLILLDILMSGKDGREICKKIKADQSTKNIPVILFSAHPTAAKSFKEFGADDFLAKPFEARDLLGLLSKYI